MIGTLVNCAAILTGSFIGSRLKKGIRDEHQEIMMQAMGLAATALGINAIVKYMPQSKYPVLFIVSLAIGGLLGEKIHLEDRFKKFVTGFSNGNLAQGLSTAILLFCVGTLFILGPMESALKGDHTYLFTNAMLDFVTSSVLASTFGFGIALAAIVLFFWQGFFYCLALLLAGVMSPAIMAEISIIGGILIFSSGLSILGIKNFRTMNMLPAFLVPAVFFIIRSFL